MSRPVHLALLAAVLLAALTGVSAAAPPAAVKGYTAAAAPAVVAVGAGAAVTVTLTNAATSTQAFASAEVRVRTAAGLDAASAAVARTGWSVAAGTSGELTVLRLTSTGRGTANAVAPGGSVSLRLPVLPTAPAGQVPFTTQVKQSNDFSGTGNDFARTGAEPSVTLTAAAVPVAIEFVQGPSDVQRSPAGPATPGTTPLTVMCPAPSVRLVDASGATATSASPTAVTLEAVGADPGLRLDGSTDLSRVTSSGVATFGAAPSADGTCATGLTATELGLDHRLAARAVLADGTVLRTTAAQVFDVLSFYALCAAECTSPRLSGDGTTAQVRATGGTGAPDRLVFTVGQDQWTEQFAAQCPSDLDAAGRPNPYRQVVTVDLADHDKAVELRWSKQAVQWATDNGASKWRVCMAAAYDFAAVGGQSVPVLEGSTTWWVGELLPCASVPAGSGPCLSSLRRSGGEQVATVVIPDVPGDPRMI